MLYGRAGPTAALDVPKLEPAPETVPERLETGTLNHEGIAGGRGGGGVARVARRRWQTAGSGWPGVYDAQHEREVALFARLWDGLGTIKGVTRYGPPPSAAPHRYRVPEHRRRLTRRDAATALADEGLFASSGDFYATTVVERLGFEPGADCCGSGSRSTRRG